jgi:hypothetical protein
VIVNAYRRDDALVHDRMARLLPRDQAWFNIPEGFRSPSGWSAAAGILKAGIGASTLPSDKLRAIVACAREIMRTYKEEHEGEEGDTIPLGADDFLPVFIYAVLRSDLGRAASLLALLSGFCSGNR